MRTLTKVASATVLTAVTAVGGAGIAAAAGSAHAGSAIFMQSDRGMGRCSLTAVASKDGVDYGVTAGHCLQGNVSRITDVNGEVIANQDDIAAGKAMLDESNGGLNDFAYFRLVKGTEVSNLVYSSPTLGIQPVDQFLVDASRFFALPVGDPVPVTQDMVGQPVCKDGSSTGRTCGVVLNGNVETQPSFPPSAVTAAPCCTSPVRTASATRWAPCPAAPRCCSTSSTAPVSTWP